MRGRLLVILPMSTRPAPGAPVERLLGSREYALGADFIRTAWRSDHILARDEGLFRWQYLENPGWKDPDKFSVSIIESDGKLDSLLGFVPFDLNLRGKILPASWMSLWVSDPQNQSLAGVKAFLRVRNDYSVVASIGMSSFSSRTYRALGGVEIQSINRYVLFLQESKQRLLNFLLRNPGTESTAVLEETPLRWNANRSLNLLPAVDWHTGRLENWDAEIWERIRWSYVGAARDFQFMKWRYLNHPRYEYRIFGATLEDQSGFVVWRIQPVSHPDAADGESESPVMRIVDFFVTDERLAEVLVQRLLEHCESEGVLFADFYSTDLSLGSLLVSQGFSSVRDDWNLSIPTHFNPLTWSVSPLNSALVESEPQGVAGQFSSGGFYLSLADSDQDRPNV
jgi:hypothetical protein